ncbi:MAG: ImmA/IrrE family metallo-endopeptidase [Actinomycetota bacterium]
MVRVTVSERLLGWAVERSGRPEVIGRRFPKLPEWLTGESLPTLRQLEQLANATFTPLGYLFLQEPPQEALPIPHFRTLGDQPSIRPSPDLLETVQTMERRQAWMRDYLIDEGCEALEFPGSMPIKEDPAQVAHMMREILGLAEGWASEQPTWTAALRELQNRIDEAGVLVAVNGVVGNNTHRTLDPDEFRGFVLTDEYAPLVFINGADGKAAQMFTLAHELAHVWFGRSAAFDLRGLQPARDEGERACNRAAAEFLVPSRELRDTWPSIQREPDCFQAAARQFKVSEIVAARRALDLRLISEARFHDFYHAYEEQDRRSRVRQKGGDFYASQNLRLGRRFAETVVRAARGGRLLYRDAYQLTGLYGESFEKYAHRLGLEGAA